MTGLRQLPTITFRAGRRQRRYMTFFVTCCLAAGVTIAVLVLPSHRGRAEPGAWIGLALLIVLAVLLFLVRAAHVTIDTRGLRIWSMSTRRSFAWSEIKAIYSQRDDHPDDDWSERVRVEPFGDRAFDLPRPSNSSTSGGNPDYERQVATIIEYWRAAAAR